jgi:hypothetical protein
MEKIPDRLESFVSTHCRKYYRHLFDAWVWDGRIDVRDDVMQEAELAVLLCDGSFKDFVKNLNKGLYRFSKILGFKKPKYCGFKNLEGAGKFTFEEEEEIVIKKILGGKHE